MSENKKTESLRTVRNMTRHEAAPRKVVQPAGTNLEVAHLYNQKVVLETVRLHGPLSRVEISGHTALSTQTVSNIVDKFMGCGVLQTLGRRSGRRGQPAIEIDLNPQGGFAVGLQLDRDHMTGVLLDLEGTVLQRIHKEWLFPSPEEGLPYLIETVRSFIADQGLHLEQIWGVGLALPGPLDLQAGSAIAPPNFPGWDGVPIRDLLSEAVHLPVYLENDATAAAVGERWFGNGRNLNNYFYVHFGIGLGGGMILDGRPYRGASDTAAMFGHIPVDPAGARCACGGIGCLENYASLASLYSILNEHGRDGREAADLTKLYQIQDPILMGWLNQAVEKLIPGLIMIENILNPEAIIFGGRLPDELLGALVAMLDARLPSVRMRALSRHPRLLRAEAAGDSAVLGAGTLPLFAAFSPEHAILSKA